MDIAFTLTEPDGIFYRVSQSLAGALFILRNLEAFSAICLFFGESPRFFHKDCWRVPRQPWRRPIDPYRLSPKHVAAWSRDGSKTPVENFVFRLHFRFSSRNLSVTLAKGHFVLIFCDWTEWNSLKAVFSSKGGIIGCGLSGHIGRREAVSPAGGLPPRMFPLRSTRFNGGTEGGNVGGGDRVQLFGGL
jgi:hypothetical protein